MKQNANMRTFQTRLHIEDSTNSLLQQTAGLFATVKHSLAALIAKGKSPNDLKTPFLRQFQITARHFNACRVEVEGIIASIKERRPALIALLKEKIQALHKTIKSLEKRQKDPL